MSSSSATPFLTFANFVMAATPVMAILIAYVPGFH